MIETILVLQVLSFGVVIVTLIKLRGVILGHTHLSAEAETPHVVPTVLSNPDIHEVFERHDEHWVHHGWVRHNVQDPTPAWLNAYNTPGLAIRPPQGEIMEGIQ